MSQQLLKQEVTVFDILQMYGKQFTQVRKRYSDGHNERCAIDVIMSYFGWDDRDNFDAARGLFVAIGELKRAPVSMKTY
jgi:hypothetical protein